MKLTPKNWHSFQHYKNRAPIWIKLHRALLDNADFHRLPVASRALAPMLWLLASEYEDGEITAEIDDIAWRFRMSADEFRSALQPLIDKGFFELIDDASEPLSACKPIAMPEKRRDREREETEGGGFARASDAAQIDLEDAIAATETKPAPSKSMISEDAFEISRAVLEAMGKDPFAPLSVGAPLTVQSWLNSGFPRECILAGVKLGMQSRRGEAPSTLKYFEKAIGRAHAELTTIIQLGEGHAQADRARPESLGDVANRLADAGITFGPKPTGIRDQESRPTHELVPQG